MVVYRRQFLKFLAQSTGVAFLPARLRAHTLGGFLDPGHNIILGGGQYADSRDPTAFRYTLSVVNLSLNDKRLIPLDFLAHGVIVDPRNKYRLICFEKIGPGACEIDLNTLKKTRTISTSKEKYFYGHGAFSKNGNTLFSTETYLSNRKGIIAIRDSNSMETLGEFPTYGDNPHECQLIDEGKTLVITNAGSINGKNKTPSVTYVDVPSQQLLERVTLTNERLNTGHIGIGENGDLVVASAPRDELQKNALGGISIKPNGKSMASMSSPINVIRAMTGEALSVVIQNDKNIAAVTHPDGNMVTFWSIPKRELLRVIPLEKPRGVSLSLDEKTFIISFGKYTDIISVNVETLNTQPDDIIKLTYLSGSHIYNWSKLLNEILPLGDMA